jgi:hypothetical protein
MRAAAVLGLILLAAPALAQPPLAREPAREAPAPADLRVETMLKWTADYIDAAGYGFVYADRNAAYFISLPEQDFTKTTVRIALRREMFAPTTGRRDFRYRSARSVADVDCAMPRTRLLATDLYQWSNFQGERSSTETQGPQWLYPRERTASEAIADFACRTRRLALDKAKAP